MAVFQLKNLVFPADSTVSVQAFCFDSKALEKIEAGYISGNGCHQDGSIPDSLRKFEPVPFKVCGNILDFELTLRGEGFHTLKLQYTIDGKSDYEYLEFYSLLPDLYKMFPYKGNFHSHTTDSDGLHTPQNTLCIARESGFDFTAFSEHRLYTDHNKEFEELCNILDIKLFHAEEVHSLPRWICHILSIGAREGVTPKQSEASYAAMVEEAKADFPELESELQNYAAQCKVIVKLIHDAGGCAVHCHPFWKHTGRLNVPHDLAEKMFHDIDFDLIELITCENFNNSLANAKYHELVKSSRDLPVMAGNDWHGQNQERMACAYNIVFADDCTEEKIISSIRAGKNAAVCGEECPMLFGNFRMVSYAQFLVNNYYPAVDSVSEQLGLELICNQAAPTSRASELKAKLDLMKMMLKY